MSTDVKAYVEFLHGMEWEGGLEGIVSHGFSTTGDAKLDTILYKLDMLMAQARVRMNTIEAEHQAEIERYYYESDD